MNPASAIFGAGVALRNALYDRKILKSSRLSVPVASIGNISVGGSGKTPLVIALGGLLQAQGIAFDVLSRGYGRSSRETAIVDPNGSPEQFGDEPLLIARRLRAPVIVGSDRYQAGLLAEKTFSPQLHLLDDGFQHRRLHRDADIVLLTAQDREDTLLPVGRLRETPAALRRAHVLVTPSDAPSLAKIGNDKPVWRVRRKLAFSGTSSLLGTTTRVVAFCGIARPGQFFSGLAAMGMNPRETVAFPDHHRYRRRDIERLAALQEKNGAEGFVTTEKDAINLGPLGGQLKNLEIVRLELEFDDPARVTQALLGLLKRLAPGREPHF